MKGIGIRVGPSLGLITMKNQIGEGPINPEFGALAEFLFSPALSVELGAKFGLWFYEADEKFDQLSFPMLPTNGTLATAEVESKVLEFPINLKYRHPATDKTNLITSVGFSPVYFLEQAYEYDYFLDVTVPITGTVNVNETTPTQKPGELYLGMMNLGIGANTRLKNGKHLEIMLSYRRALTDMGVELNKPGILGLNARYWFDIR